MPSFNRFYEALVAAGIDFASDTIKIALLTNSWTPSRTLDFYSELTNELASGDGYTTGGVTLASKAVNTTGNVIYLDAADPSWAFTAGKSFRYAVIYKDTGTPGTSPLAWYIDLNSTGNLTMSGTYKIQLNTSGLIALGDAA